MKKKKSKNIKAVLTSILVTLAIYTGALAIFLYVQGWRFDFISQTIKQVGVLTVESSPTFADIYVDGEHKGRTNKSMSLDTGTYDVKVSKDGYYDWEKKVNILEEKSTPIFPFLIKTNFEKESIYTSNLTLLKYWADNTNNHLILLTKEKSTYSFIHYDINTGFLTLNPSPANILSIKDDSKDPISEINLTLSPSGEMAILQVITESTDSKYVISTLRNSTFEEVSKDPLSLSGFNGYDITWSKDEKYLLLESKDEVVSYNLNKNTKQLLLKKVNELDKWSTDSDGFFYIFKNIKDLETNGVIKYTLKQYSLDGSGEKIIIPTIYFQQNTDYIKTYRDGNFDFGYFTNSPESTQTIGKIASFTLNQDVKGLYIQTDVATYWYDLVLDKYLTVSPYSSKLLEFSPDKDKILIKTPTNYSIFVFDKEEGDHTITIGSHIIQNLNYDKVVKINWLSNSSYLQIQEDGYIYIIDKDGDNKTNMLENQDIEYWTITSSRDKLITLTYSKEKGIEITGYKIH